MELNKRCKNQNEGIHPNLKYPHTYKAAFSLTSATKRKLETPKSCIFWLFCYESTLNLPPVLSSLSLWKSSWKICLFWWKNLLTCHVISACSHSSAQPLQLCSQAALTTLPDVWLSREFPIRAQWYHLEMHRRKQMALIWNVKGRISS